MANDNFSVASTNKALRKFNKLVVKYKNELVKELATQGADVMQIFYDGKGFESDNKPAKIKAVKTKDGYEIRARGTGVIYEEFGTGDVGEANKHKISPTEFGLKNYNTGATIRDYFTLSDKLREEWGINSGMYWSYESNGEYIFTQGIPAGMFVYDTSEWLHKNIKEIATQKAGEVLSKH